GTVVAGDTVVVVVVAGTGSSQWSIGPIFDIAPALAGASGPGSSDFTTTPPAAVQFDVTSWSAAASASATSGCDNCPSPPGPAFSWPVVARYRINIAMPSVFSRERPLAGA